MALCSTGALGMLSCPQGACSSIGTAMYGASPGAVSLRAMFGINGMSCPNCMTNFHSFNGDLYVCPTPITSLAAAGQTTNVCAIAVCTNTFTTSTACSWLHPAAPAAPSLAGTSQSVTVDANSGAARSGTICYIPSHCGSVQTIIFCQLAAGAIVKCVNVGSIGGTGCGGSLTTTCQCGILSYTPALSAGECYCGTFDIANSVTSGNNGGTDSWVVCNGTIMLHCCTTTVCGIGSVSFVVKFGDSVCLCALAHTPSSTCTGCACSNVYISSITSIVGGECLGALCTCVSTFTG